MTIDDVITIAEEGIELAQDGLCGTLELEDAWEEAEEGSPVYELAYTMSGLVEEIEVRAQALNEVVHYARSELLDAKRKKVTA